MATREKTAFYCTECGNESRKWQGQCPACNAWNTLEEAPLLGNRAGKGRGGRKDGPRPFGLPTPITLETVKPENAARISTGNAEVDRVLGGGLVRGHYVAIGGEPGIGKSTLLLQVAGALTAAGHPTLYISGEENAGQVALRAERLGGGATRVAYLSETDVDQIIGVVQQQAPAVVIIDSIQTIYASDVEGAPGNISQVRECVARLQRLAKDSENGTAVFVIGHVTKDGAVAGPKTFEHAVDTVIYFESVGTLDLRVLRATKNRFGSVDEIGVFRMAAKGLEVVANPSEIFLANRRAGSAGSAILPVMEGTRPVLVEIQGLVSPPAFGSPQRVVNGIDPKRVAFLLAVLQKRAGYPLIATDVFLNVAGGLKVTEPGADLAVAAALASAAHERAIPADTVLLAEIGLGGELRPVPQMERRLSEAARLGFGTAIVPERGAPRQNACGLHLHHADDLTQALVGLFGALPDPRNDERS